MQAATSARQCGMCMELGKQCENCENDALHAAADMEEDVVADGSMGEMDVGGSRVRSKSPLISSAERPGKVLKVGSDVPLARIPTFPAIISEDKGKGDKGKGGEVGKGEGKGKGGKKGLTH